MRSLKCFDCLKIHTAHNFHSIRSFSIFCGKLKLKSKAAPSFSQKRSPETPLVCTDENQHKLFCNQWSYVNVNQTKNQITDL